MNLITRSLLHMVAVFLIVTGLLYILSNSPLSGWVHELWPILTIIFFGISIGTATLVNYIITKDRQQFVLAVMGSTVLRLLISVGVFLILYLKGVENRNAFLATFFFLYLWSVVFEITSLYSNLRLHFKRPKA